MSATKPTYAELLRDPRWQQRRLRVLDAGGWKCEECGAKCRELHVHHGYYGKGMKPWEYPDDTLHVLCDECHKIAEELLTDIRRRIGSLKFPGLSRLLEFLEQPVVRPTKFACASIVEQFGRPSLLVFNRPPDFVETVIEDAISEATEDDDCRMLNALLIERRLAVGLTADGREVSNGR